MNYVSGEEIQVGDNVLIERRRTPGVVEYVIETDNDMKEWNLDERGILILSEPFGCVFWPIDEVYDPVVFVSRKTT